MLNVRKAKDRGHVQWSWLDTHHTFSFGSYYDAEHLGFRSLRVINDDRIAPGGGFPFHPHRDMEILTYVLQGALAHQDNLGHRSIIRPGEVQRMTAGSGIVHSEHNASNEAPLHLLQIWILPERSGLEPGYEQRRFPHLETAQGLRLVASRDGRDGSLTIHQDADVLAGKLAAGEGARYELDRGRGAWVHVVRGAVRLNDAIVEEGGGVSVEGESLIAVDGRTEAEILLFDLR